MRALLHYLLFLLPSFIMAQSFDCRHGIWEGTLDTGVQGKLQLRLTFATDDAGRFIGRLDCPSQGVVGLPAEVECDSMKLRVQVPSIGASYEAQYIEGHLEGTFRQSGLGMPLVLEYCTEPTEPSRPQTPRGELPYRVEEVTFANTEGDMPAVLRGTLTYPQGYIEGEKISQVVLMVSGSGPQDRDETLMGHKPFAVLADYLARHGVASLRYDDRGVAASEGDFANATTRTFAEDAAAGVDYLRGVALFHKVGVLGHSEGGTIAMILAAEGKVDFAISMAGSFLPGSQVIQDQFCAELERANIPAPVIDNYITANSELINLLHTTPVDSLTSVEVVSLALQHSGVQLPFPQLLMLKGFADNYTPWLDYFLYYDPASTIAQVHCPVLAINGSLDQQVLAEPHLACLGEYLPVSTPRQIVNLEGQNHLFQHATTGAPSEYYWITETLSSELLDTIVSWLGQLQPR